MVTRAGDWKEVKNRYSYLDGASATVRTYARLGNSDVRSNSGGDKASFEELIAEVRVLCEQVVELTGALAASRERV